MAAVRPAGPEPTITTWLWLPGPSGLTPLPPDVRGTATAWDPSVAIAAALPPSSRMFSVGKLGIVGFEGSIYIFIVAGLHTPRGYPAGGRALGRRLGCSRHSLIWPTLISGWCDSPVT